MTIQPVDVSIVIVSWNTRMLTCQCLASLPAAAGGLQWDAWVVDNASEDGSVAAIEAQFPHVHVIANAGNVGFAAANNQGIVASQGRYVLLLNSDTVMPVGSLAALVGFADRHPRAGVIGPMLVNPDGSYQTGPTPFPSVWNELLSASGLGPRLTYRGYPSRSARAARMAQTTDYVGGACMLGRREAIAQVGGLDEGYFMYSEEPDWCWRMRQHGWEVWYTPDSSVVHFGGQSTRQVREAMLVALYRSKVRFLRLHKGRRHGIVLAGGLAAISRGRRLVRRLLGLTPPGLILRYETLVAGVDRDQRALVPQNKGIDPPD
jgi:N-acetylglucosaminyl-diphospho-decaprenol L-rhamnosyltransferase